VKVVNILFILWFIVFAAWLASQFKQYNRNKDSKR
jgi:flagellar biogenesis protein FliO